jgi:hypothetical protein
MSIATVLRPFALAVLMLAGTASAAFPQTDEEANDPPGRVGRLSYTEGTVSFRSADEDQWVPATLNFPVTTGDAFWTEPNARAEIQIGSTDLRLDQTTAIQIVRLDDDATQLQVDQGSVNLRVREMPPGGVILLTPHATMVIDQPGRYHVDVAAPTGDAPGDSVRLAVLEGMAHVEGLAAPLTVTAGHSATMRADEPFPMLAQAVALPLDMWALERERLLNPQQALQYVSPEMTGVQDLDTYGQWAMEPTYGAVWYPQAVPMDWAPYRYGHWAYVQPWGWTWIDHQPWGFAPFHFGRWVRIHDRWGWCPGARVHRPVFAPALVAFVGRSGSAVLVSRSHRAPAVAWVPLGPREIFRPPFRHSARFARNVNITNVHVTNITVINKDGRRHRDHDSFRDFHNRDGFTAVSAAAFTGAAPVNSTRVRLRDDDLADARRAESLDTLRPSRSARAGVVVPAVTTAGRDSTGSADAGRRLRHDRGEWLAPPSSARSASAAPPRDPNVLPRAPGPDRQRFTNRSRDRQRPDGGPSVAQQDRQPAVTPLNRPDRAPSALRTPESRTAAPPAIRSNEPPGRTPNGALPSHRPPAVAPNRADDPLGRVRDSHNERRDVRDSGRARIEEPHRTAPATAPVQPPRRIAPEQMPGTAPHTVAPTPPASQRATPPRDQTSRREPRRERRPEADQRQDLPRVSTMPAQPRVVRPPREPTAASQRPIRPERPTPEHGAPPRRDDREVRREPSRTVIMPQQSVSPGRQAPSRQIQPQNADRRAPHAAPAPSRTPQPAQQSSGSRRSDAPGQNRGRGLGDGSRRFD